MDRVAEIEKLAEGTSPALSSLRLDPVEFRRFRRRGNNDRRSADRAFVVPNGVVAVEDGRGLEPSGRTGLEDPIAAGARGNAAPIPDAAWSR